MSPSRRRGDPPSARKLRPSDVPSRRPLSQVSVAAGGDLQCLGWVDVALEQDGEVAVPGLGGDPVQRDACLGGGGGVARAQRVGGDPVGGQAC